MRDQEWESGIQRIFGFSIADFDAKGMTVRRGPVPHYAIQIKLTNGTWSDSILSLAELGEFFQTAPEKEWKKK